MNQFSRNSALIFKTFLYQIVMSFFGIMMYTATSFNPLLLGLGQVMVIAFFLYIMSSQSYQMGFKSCEFDRAHNTSTSPYLGFLLAALAFLPTICRSLWTLVFPPFAYSGEAQGIGYVPFLLNKTFLQGMYVTAGQWIFPTEAGGSSEALAIANGLALNKQCWIHLIGALPGLVATGISFLIGHKRFSNEKKKEK
jgi:hypothetical protein